MRRATTALMVVVLAGLTAATVAFAAEPYQGSFDQTYALAETGRVSLENVNGDLTIEVWDRAEVRVQAVKEASSTELLDELQIDVRPSANSIRVRTEYPHQRGFFGSHGRVQVEYTLTVPRGAEIDDVDMVNGDVVISDVRGGVHVETVNGSIETKDVAGEVELSTVNGSIRPTFNSLQEVRSVHLESVNGTIELELPSSADASIDAETVNGRINNDFGLSVHKGKYVGSDLHGVLGGGDLAVELETVNGRISVNRR